MHKNRNSFLSLFFCCAVIAGCATQTRVVRTETAYEQPTAESTVVRKTESTERRTETRQEGGLISGTVDIVGKTVALPFKVVGGLIDVIF
jgi:hypothetical protein